MGSGLLDIPPQAVKYDWHIGLIYYVYKFPKPACKPIYVSLGVLAINFAIRSMCQCILPCAATRAQAGKRYGSNSNDSRLSGICNQQLIRKLIISKRTGNKQSPLILPPYRYLHTTRLPFIHPAASHHMYIMGLPYFCLATYDTESRAFAN